MQDITKYPHFILDKPSGEDWSDGHSQDKLAHGVCDYVRLLDAKPDTSGKETISIPRIIGLEGSWGTGKSNVVSMIAKELTAEGYYTFTYDAWGHQEDLQRRSILETLSVELINEKVLQGKATIKMRNGKDNIDTWSNQLSLLLSNKTTTIRKSTPKLTSAAIWGISIVALFAICSLIAGQLIESTTDFFSYWWIDFIPIILAILVAAWYRIKDGSFDNIIRMVDHTNNDTIDEEYTSSEEPSVAEFKNWMHAVSKHLGETKGQYQRLIIVFDNMDRLPSDKVMQLWSSIYTFFAGGEFEHIWTIIPYDYQHLCQAIYGSEDNDEKGEKDVERIKSFISKTFPITYHVPQPVITDYRKIFNTYFEEAFGPGLHDQEHICQVFMHLEENPNPRTVIRFVNELVAMRLQWGDEKYRLQNQALYILKKDYLFYADKHMDTQLLSDGLFDKVAPFYPDQDKVRTELCQYAYGLDDEKLANETPLRNELKRKIEAGEPISEYVDNPIFLSVFETVLAGIDQTTLNKAVKSLTSLDNVELSADAKERIKEKWDFLANMKARSVYDSHHYDETLTTLIRHATTRRVVNMAHSYASAMQRLKVSDGASYFHAQHNLQLALREAKVDFDDSTWYQSVVCEPDQFAQYVCTAKEEYVHYGLTSESKALNEFLLNGTVSGNSKITTVVDFIKDDENYDLSELKQGLSKAIQEDIIKQDICVAAYVHRVLSEEVGVMKTRFKTETVATYLNGNQTPWAEKLPMGLEDVIAMSLADGKDLKEIDEKMLPRICKCMGRYFEYTHLLEHTGKEGSAYRELNVYCVEHLKGGPLNTVYAARHLVDLQKALGLEQEQLLKQFNQWSAIKWGEINTENQYVKEVKNYVHQSYFAAYRDNAGNFSKSVIKLGVEAMGCQNTGFLAGVKQVQQNYSMVTKMVVDGYWKAFVEAYLGTEYMTQASALLTNEVVSMLQWLYDHNEMIDAKLVEIVLGHADESTLKSYLHTMMNDYLSKTNINKAKFLWFGKLLPLLGADMDQNTARGLMTHFIKPISKEAECAAVIVSHKDFYLTILRKDTSIAEPIVKEMVAMDGFAEIADELKTIVA